MEKKPSALVNRIIRQHGAVIDLRKNPEIMIDILRKFADEIPDGGTPCAGVPPAPSPPPGPSSFQGRVTNEDLMRAVLKLSKDVSALKKLPAMGGRGR